MLVWLISVGEIGEENKWITNIMNQILILCNTLIITKYYMYKQMHACNHQCLGPLCGALSLNDRKKHIVSDILFIKQPSPNEVLKVGAVFLNVIVTLI